MNIEYRILAAGNDEFPVWVGIACMVDDRVASVSWAPPEAVIGARLNLDHPFAFDERTGETVAWCMPDQPTAELLGLSADDIAALRKAATDRGLI